VISYSYLPSEPVRGDFLFSRDEVGGYDWLQECKLGECGAIFLQKTNDTTYGAIKPK